MVWMLHPFLILFATLSVALGFFKPLHPTIGYSLYVYSILLAGLLGGSYILIIRTLCKACLARYCEWKKNMTWRMRAINSLAWFGCYILSLNLLGFYNQQIAAYPPEQMPAYLIEKQVRFFKTQQRYTLYFKLANHETLKFNNAILYPIINVGDNVAFETQQGNLGVYFVTAINIDKNHLRVSL